MTTRCDAFLCACAGAVAAIAMVLGAPAGLAAAADLLSLTALPLVAAHLALAALLRWQLTAMRAMWRLLRGRGLPFRRWAAPGCVFGTAVCDVTLPVQVTTQNASIPSLKAALKSAIVHAVEG